MDIVYLVEADWHTGIPDGERSFQEVFPFFETENEPITRINIKKLLTNAKLLEKYHEVEFFHINHKEVSVSLKDTREQGYDSLNAIHISITPLLEKQGSLFELKQVFVK